jgi:hypothetical protein
MYGVDRVVFGSDFGPVPYGIKEHVQRMTRAGPAPIKPFTKSSCVRIRRPVVRSDDAGRRLAVWRPTFRSWVA